jgi:acylphosphatase
LIKVRLIISGRVQGVFFRQYVHDCCQKLEEITGFVRNLYSGEVEVLAYHKNRKTLEKLVQLCYQGSKLSHVSSIKEEWEDNPNDFEKYYQFIITRTI